MSRQDDDDRGERQTAEPKAEGSGALPFWAVSIPPDSPAPPSSEPGSRAPLSAEPGSRAPLEPPTETLEVVRPAEAQPATAEEQPPPAVAEEQPQAAAEPVAAESAGEPAPPEPPSEPVVAPEAPNEALAPPEAPSEAVAPPPPAPEPASGVAQNVDALPPPAGESGGLAATVRGLFPQDRPEVVIGAAFLAGYLFAQLLKRLAR